MVHKKLIKGVRNTQNLYLNLEDYASDHLIDFARKNAGNRILDLGCANGEYCIKLNNEGFECTGCDINPEYIKEAQNSGINAYLIKDDTLEFPDNSFDTVLIFEVLEHVKDPSTILLEAKRVVRKNILITVPNCTDFFELKDHGLTYEHMLEIDHVNFYTYNELKDLLSKFFKNFSVEEGEPIDISLLGLPSWLKYSVAALRKLKLVEDKKIYFRLFANIEV
jgi:ubiquinone/menaquinone biosynthesis C-methylase UbiE